MKQAKTEAEAVLDVFDWMMLEYSLIDFDKIGSLRMYLPKEMHILVGLRAVPY